MQLIPGWVIVNVLPATSIVPVLELVLVFAVTVIVILPLPDPDDEVDNHPPPEVTLAVQLQPLGAVTVEMLE